MRRIIAMFIDCCLVLIYALLLFLINKNANLNITELQANLLGLITMILPVGFYFLVSDYKGASLGKKLMKLKVTCYQKRMQGMVLRTLVFITPWIIGHSFVYRGFYSQWHDTLTLTILAVMSYGLLLLNYLLMIFRKDHRVIHELLSQTKVELAD